MNPASVDMKDILVTAGEGTFGSLDPDVWGIHIATEPSDVDKTITLYDIINPKPATTQNIHAKPIFSNLVSVRVKANGYETGYAKARDVFDVLTTKGQFDIAGDSVTLDVRYFGIFTVNDVSWLQKDDQERDVFIFDVMAKRRESV